jgi:hypothetical protein
MIYYQLQAYNTLLWIKLVRENIGLLWVPGPTRTLGTLGSSDQVKTVQEKLIYPSPSGSLGTNRFNQPDYPTRVPSDTYTHVHLGITRDLRDTTHDTKLDRAPEISGRGT